MPPQILETETFRLLMEAEIFEEELDLPNNAILRVRVESDGFQGESSLDVDAKALARFALDMRALYDTLSGSARVEEPYGMHQHLAFSCDSLGHIAVRGFLHGGNRAGRFHELRFENEFDQTYLYGFIRELVDAYARYLPGKGR